MASPGARGGTPLGLSRFLTPCRTTGLKRKTSSPLLPIQQPSPGIGTQSESRILVTPKRTPLRRPASVESPLIPSKEKLPSEGDCAKKKLVCIKPVTDRLEINQTKQKPVKDAEATPCSSADQPQSFSGFCTPQDIVELVTDINSIEKKLTQKSEQSHIYSKQHNLENLKKTTDQWKTVIKEAVLEIQETIKSRQVDVSLASILNEHNIPFEDVEFNEEVMDFE